MSMLFRSPTSVVLGLGLLLLSCGTLPIKPRPSEPSYVLPYAVGERYSLLQGNNGRWGHQDASRYAFDFRLEIGTAVLASRAGLVVAIEERYEDGNRTPGEENYVVVQHEDSTFSRYYHLTREGAVVEEGQVVGQGELVGLSGDTGASAGPHLHFDVTAKCPEWGCQTVEIAFANASENPLREGETYEALRY